MTKKKANYKFDFTESFLIIFELTNEQMEDQNRRENIFNEIAKMFTVKTLIVIFRDFNGEVTQLLTDTKGQFIGYEFPMKEKLLSELSLDAMEMRFEEYKDERAYRRAIKGYL